MRILSKDNYKAELARDLFEHGDIFLGKDENQKEMHNYAFGISYKRDSEILELMDEEAEKSDLLVNSLQPIMADFGHGSQTYGGYISEYDPKQKELSILASFLMVSYDEIIDFVDNIPKNAIKSMEDVHLFPVTTVTIIISAIHIHASNVVINENK